MPRTITFHLDEHIPRAIADGLRREGIDVTTTSEAELIGASDEEHLNFARREQRVIFTQDNDFLRWHHAGVNYAGIVYCARGARTIGDMIQSLIFMWDALDPEDMANQVEYI
ncbi:MAG: DUF5615 family PIN-like protein [Candidatus Poribacteria bacterium]|nr:DUF5615 family PIN-like protein [Candidatus Poribacteria bacterium]